MVNYPCPFEKDVFVCEFRLADHIRKQHPEKVYEEYANLYVRLNVKIEELGKNFMEGDIDVQLDESTENIANYVTMRTLKRILKKE